MYHSFDYCIILCYDHPGLVWKEKKKEEESMKEIS